MAFKLTRDEDERYAQFKEKLGELFTDVEKAVDSYNEAMSKAQDEITGSVNVYNETLAEFKSFVDGVASRGREEIDEKSENWLAGDNGQAANDWVEAWEGADLEEVSISTPDEVTVEFENHGDMDLPTDASG